MPRREAPQIPTVTHGSASLKVYSVKRGHRTIYSVAHNVSGRRQLKQFTDQTAALQWAYGRAKAIDKGNPATVTLSAQDAFLFERSKQLVAGIGKSLEQAVNEYVEAVGILDGISTLSEAASFYRKRHGLIARKAIPEIVDELLADREGSLRAASYRDLKIRLGHVAKDFTGFIGNVTHVEMSAWLRARKISDRSRLNYRRVMVTLFRFAQERGYLAEGKTEPEKMKVRVQNETDVEIFTPAEMRQLLKAATTANQLPFVLFGGFAGLRSAEIARLEWRDVDLSAKQIEIRAGTAKTRSRRLVPISNNLSAWLRPLARTEGRVSMIDRPDLMVSSLAERCTPKVAWRRNGLRHSYVSYRLALIGKENQVSMESGHSPQMLFRHYRALVSKAQAKEWFSITPRDIE